MQREAGAAWAGERDHTGAVIQADGALADAEDANGCLTDAEDAAGDLADGDHAEGDLANGDDADGELPEGEDAGMLRIGRDQAHAAMLARSRQRGLQQGSVDLTDPCH